MTCSHALKLPPSCCASEDKLAPNLGLSGKLAAETNTVNGVVLKFQPPAEAKVATKRWRLYVFKNGKLTDQVGGCSRGRGQARGLSGHRHSMSSPRTLH
jgi:hypothetical protein